MPGSTAGARKKTASGNPGNEKAQKIWVRHYALGGFPGGVGSYSHPNAIQKKTSPARQHQPLPPTPRATQHLTNTHGSHRVLSGPWPVDVNFPQE